MTSIKLGQTSVMSTNLDIWQVNVNIKIKFSSEKKLKIDTLIEKYFTTFFYDLTNTETSNLKPVQTKDHGC